MRFKRVFNHPGPRLWLYGVAFVGAAFAATNPSPAAAQSIPSYRIEHEMPLYGGYLPFGGYPRYSGAPYGGYTPWGVQGEGGWLKLKYGLGHGYNDFTSSNYFGSDIENGYHRNHNDGTGNRPTERGRGRWNSYGSAGIDPPPGP